MASYPTSLAPLPPLPQLKGVPEHDEQAASGNVTPSHGGTILTGHEYDMTVHPRSYRRDPSPLRSSGADWDRSRQPDADATGLRSAAPPSSAAAAAQAAQQTDGSLFPPINGAPALPPNASLSSSSRPPRARPVSMPPQQTPPRLDDDATISSKHSHRPSVSGGPDPGRSKSSVRIVGDYTLTKTLGAGSMGKVKLAQHNETGEKLAIKIVPRSPTAHTQPSLTPNTLPPTAANAEALTKSASKEASKEIRTIREASLSLLLHHPYICGMRELIIHPHHYYMVFEYVSGGQMLDYIISHGRLRERVARKFARQIGSALEYLHKNSVVHRDLKIENILISQSGNIKLIDFGLSNLYNPLSHLSTFCGSLYFAAPELLNAKVYTGPEVDVWSFGVVLYVLVCGKVPFDDQSMPALHAKIKRGVVEYPNWLSQECKHLLSRMLVTNPVLRATLSEVLLHPWMNRSFPNPPSAHLLPREPLRADDLDRDVIRRMTGFEFGTEDDIEGRLRGVLENEGYRRAVDAWDRKREREAGRSGWSRSDSSFGENGSSATNPFSTSNTTVATSNSTATGGTSNSSPGKKGSKRFSGFDYYRRKLFSAGTSPPTTPISQLPPQISSPSSPNSGAQNAFPEREPADPTRGFHPLISIYYLVREKIERERVYGPGHFASSQLSLVGDEVLPSSAPPEVPSKVGLALPTPLAPALPQKSAYNVPTPRLPAPPPSYFSTTSYGVEQPSPSPTAAAFPAAQPQPRARAPDSGIGQHLNEADRATVDLTKTPPSGPKTEGSKPPSGLGVGGTITAPAASTHRRSHSLSQRVGAPPWSAKELGSAAMGLPSVGENVPQTAGPEYGTFAQKVGARTVAEADEKRERERQAEREREKERERSIGWGEPPSSPGATLVRKFGSLLGGRDGARSRRGASGPGGLEESEKEREEYKIRESKSVPTPGLSVAAAGGSGKDEKENQNHHRRAATVIETPRTKSHSRRSSMGPSSVGKMLGGVLRDGMGTARPRTSQGNGSRFGEVSEEDEQEGESGPGDAMDRHGRRGSANGGMTHSESTDIKPATLKGVFSVATTSSKSPTVIKADIRRVLDRMQVQYREIRGGFECVHQPSIDLSSVAQDNDPASLSPNGPERMKRKPSRMSLGRLGKKKDTDRDAMSQRSGVVPTKEPAATLRTSNSGGSSSFFTLPLAGGAAMSPGGGGSFAGAQDLNPRPKSPSVKETFAEGQASTTVDTTVAPSSPTTTPRGKFLPPIPRDFATLSPPQRSQRPVTIVGEQEEEPNNVFENSAANDLCVRFEVNIVKVPLLPLHGIQFRRVGGNGWQYQMLARRVLTELKL